MNADIKSDLAAITNLQPEMIDALVNKIKWCICNEVELALKSDDNTVIFDFGFCKLKLTIDDSTAKWQFIPSKDTEKCVIKTINGEKNTLDKNIEKSLIARIHSIYKEMF